MLKPLGHRILVKPDEVKERTDSGIILPEQTLDREKLAMMRGIVVAVGEQAWKAFGDEPWAKVGDKVWFAKYGGFVIEDDGIQYRIMNDEDLLLAWTKDES